MNKITEFMIDGSVTLKKVTSPLNGELTVRWDMVYGYQIMGGGLWQVGGPVETVWKEALRHVRMRNISIKKALILGLGGGTTAKIIKKNWPDSHVSGVDLDPIIVHLGEEYLGLKKLNVVSTIADAVSFVKIDAKKYDLVCVDTYVGDTYPEKLEEISFLRNVSKRVNAHGIVLINRIFTSKQRKLADAFEEKLKSVFHDVKEVYPSHELVNVVYICSAPVVSSSQKANP